MLRLRRAVRHHFGLAAGVTLDPLPFIVEKDEIDRLVSVLANAFAATE